ncbi:MAG: hypothetical protein OEU74_01990 [Gammaproteobacteria bacterium]|nr:hypothetical protein [Gammaproteobacteria bacterium]
MTTQSRIWISLLAFLFIALPVTADTLRVTVETEIVEEEKKEKDTEIITIDGDKKVRLELLGEEKKSSDKTPYLLTIDGGNTWVVGNKAEAFCAQMDTAEFFRYLGSLALRFEGIANLEITDPQVKKVLEEKGPKILDYPTNHVRLVSTAAGKAAVMFKKYDYKVHITDDIWYSTKIEMHPVRKRWFEALSRSGYKQHDVLIDQWMANLPGAILKQESVIKVTNVIRKKDEIYTEKTRVVTIDKLKPSDIPKHTFQMPKCKKISKKEMRSTAMDLFEKGKLL